MRPIRRNAISRRISMVSSFFGLPDWLVWRSAMITLSVCGRDRNLPGGTDDSATDGASPSRCRARLHIYRRLPACIPNKWDRNGTPKAERATRSAYSRAAKRLQFCALCNQPVHFPAQLRNRGIQGLAPRIDDNIPLRSEFLEADSQHFPYAPFHSIAHNGLSQSAWQCETKTWT